MDSTKLGKKDDVSDPLKHLLSLDWEYAPPSSDSKEFQSDTKQLKPIKKVRFSDNVEKISWDIDAYETNTNLSLEQNGEQSTNNTCYVQLGADLEVPSQDEANVMLKSNVELIHNYEKDGIELCKNSGNSSCYKFIFDEDNLSNENILIELQDSESKIGSKSYVTEECADLSNFSNLLEIDIDDIVTKVDKISIHPSQFSDLHQSQVCKKISSVSNENIEPYSENHSSAKTDVSYSLSQNNIEPYEENKKTCLKLCKQKQSLKLNSVLIKDVNISNASELKRAVYKAWYRVKSKTSVDPEIFSRTPKSFSDISSLKISKKHVNPTSRNAHTLWKKSKNKDMQSKYKKQHKSPLILQESAKNDDEERELAFKSWKKRKDDIMKDKYVNEKRMEQQSVAVSLMTVNQRKRDSEAAFIAWEAQKSHLIKIENKKKAWLYERKKEDYIKKNLRNEEALKMYYLWLETKHFFCVKHSSYPNQTKQPWIPPGK